MRNLSSSIYAIVAEFDSPAAIKRAAKSAKEKGYRIMEAYTPFPIHGLDSALGYAKTRMPWVMFIGGIVGCLFGYFMQYYTAVIDYPLNSGGKPLHSWPSFIPVTYECTILFSAISGVIGMIGINGLPRLHHPIFNTPNIEAATIDKFFLSIESRDENFNLKETREFLESMNPCNVSEVKFDDKEHDVDDEYFEK